MASTRPPGTYSPSARTGRRGGGSGGVAGLVRRAGSDALPRPPCARACRPGRCSAPPHRRRPQPPCVQGSVSLKPSRAATSALAARSASTHRSGEQVPRVAKPRLRKKRPRAGESGEVEIPALRGDRRLADRMLVVLHGVSTRKYEPALAAGDGRPGEHQQVGDVSGNHRGGDPSSSGVGRTGPGGPGSAGGPSASVRH